MDLLIIYCNFPSNGLVSQWRRTPVDLGARAPEGMCPSNFREYMGLTRSGAISGRPIYMVTQTAYQKFVVDKKTDTKRDKDRNTVSETMSFFTV